MRSLIGFARRNRNQATDFGFPVESVEKLLLCEANVLIIRRNGGCRNVVPLPSGPRDSSASLDSPHQRTRPPDFLNASKVGRIKTDSYKPYNGQNDL